MNILVVGAHFYNKGAHLMLEAVMDNFKDHPQFNLYMSPCSGSKEQIEKLGYKLIDFPLKHVTAYRSFNIFFKFGYFIKYLNSKYRGELKLTKIDGILDISGFAYSDQWGDEAVLNLNKLMKFAVANRMKYIFLPQAFGPFTSKSIRFNMNQAVSMSDLICARDIESYNFLTELGDGKAKNVIRQYPDITINLSDSDSETYSHMDNEKYVCVVPNERMLDQGREYWPDGKYLEYLHRSIMFFKSNTKLNIIVLVHDKGIGDMDMASKVIAKYNGDDRVKLVYEENPLLLKSIIGGANLVIGSRFHALVSALSQNVPSIALGWSHKYKTLFEEFGVPEFSFDVPNDQTFDKKLNELTLEDHRSQIDERLRKSNEGLRIKLSKMWEEVKDIFNQE